MTHRHIAIGEVIVTYTIEGHDEESLIMCHDLTPLEVDMDDIQGMIESISNQAMAVFTALAEKDLLDGVVPNIIRPEP
jgi:hypothetical protein